MNAVGVIFGLNSTTKEDINILHQILGRWFLYGKVIGINIEKCYLYSHQSIMYLISRAILSTKPRLY